MRRGTTPTFSFEVDTDLTGWDIYVTFEQRKLEVTRKSPEVSATDSGCIFGYKGLYDKVEGKFYQNLGTGEFSVGDATSEKW